MPTRLRILVTKGEHGERLIDLGGRALGGLEAGRRLGEICMGGLGTVAFTQASGVPNWPLGVVVSSTDPVISCLGSQYAGWTIQDEATGFFALGSGPARALARVEDLYKELGYVDHFSQASLVIEGDKAPAACRADQSRAGLRRQSGGPQRTFRHHLEPCRYGTDRIAGARSCHP